MQVSFVTSKHRPTKSQPRILPLREYSPSLQIKWILIWSLPDSTDSSLIFTLKIVWFKTLDEFEEGDLWTICNSHAKRGFKSNEFEASDEAEFMVDNYKKIYALNETAKGQASANILEILNKMRPFFCGDEGF